MLKHAVLIWGAIHKTPLLSDELFITTIYCRPCQKP